MGWHPVCQHTFPQPVELWEPVRQGKQEGAFSCTAWVGAGFPKQRGEVFWRCPSGFFHILWLWGGSAWRANFGLLWGRRELPLLSGRLGSQEPALLTTDTM